MRYLIKLLLLLFLIIIATNKSSAQEMRIDLKKIINELKELKTNQEVLGSLKHTIDEIEEKYGIYSKEFYEVGCIYGNAFLIINKPLFANDSITQKGYFIIAKTNYEVAKIIYGTSSLQFAKSYSDYLGSIHLLNYQKSVYWNFDSLKHYFKITESTLVHNIKKGEINIAESLVMNCLSFSNLYDTKYQQDSAKVYCKKALFYCEKYANNSTLYSSTIVTYSNYLKPDEAIKFLLKYSETIKANFSDTSVIYFNHLTNILGKMLSGSGYNSREIAIYNEADSLVQNLYRIASDEFLDYEFYTNIPYLKKYNLTSEIRDELQFITTEIIEKQKYFLKPKYYLRFLLTWAEFFKSIGNESYYLGYLKIAEKIISEYEDLDLSAYVEKKSVYNELAEYYRFRKFDSCVDYHIKILKLEKKISEYHGIFVVSEYTELGKLFLDVDDYENAELYINQSQVEMKKIYDEKSFFYLSNQFTLGLIHFKTSNGKEGFEEMYPFINYSLNDSSLIPSIANSFYKDFGELYEKVNSDSSDRYYLEVYERNTMLPLRMFGLTNKEQISSLNEYNASLQIVLNQISFRFFDEKKTKANLGLAAYLFSKNQQFKYQRVFKIFQNENNISTTYNDELLRRKRLYNKSISSESKDADSLLLNYEYLKSGIISEVLLDSPGKKYLEKNLLNSFKSDYSGMQKQLSNEDCYIDIKRFNYHVERKGFYPDSAIYAFLIITNKSKDTGTYFFLRKGYSFDSIVKLNNRASAISEYLKEFLKLIQHYKNVYINPDGIFHLINWYTLKDVDGKYLLENKTLHIIQSLDEVKSEISQIFPALNKEVVLFGDPLMQNNLNQHSTAGFIRGSYNLNGANELPSLPYTKIEVEEIDKLFKQHGFNSTMYIQKYCNEDNLEKVKSPIVLHIATHGFYLNKIDSSNAKELEIYSSNPLLRSGLILSASKENDSTDNIVTAFEVIDYDLANTELVALSACETGKGKIESGQGIYGLQRAFRIAGAKTVLTSLWNVDDRATRFFMNLFYTEWLNGKSKVDALRNTQLQMAHHPLYSDPKFWGAFILVGE